MFFTLRETKDRGAIIEAFYGTCVSFFSSREEKWATEIAVQTLEIPGKCTLRGQSVAGHRTCIAVPLLQICFDLGMCSHAAINQRFVAISHGHSDHIGALHVHAFERRSQKMKEPAYFMPEHCAVSPRCL